MSQQHEQVFRGHIDPADIKKYVYLPVQVPENTQRIAVTYEFDDANNVLDIGIFDERGIEFLNAGFRGWSGGARREFYITPHSATPGYIYGPILPGTWHICLGLYEIADGGYDYQVTVKLETGSASDSDADFPHYMTLSDQPTHDHRSVTSWYKGDLHCHTYHSDGDSSPEDVVRYAESIGLDFLAIMDHNNQTQHAELQSIDTSLMLIPGYEVTTNHGHWNIWGMNRWIDFRVLSPDDMRAAMRQALEHGYLVSCNHPRRYGPLWKFDEVDDFACIEAWNGPWELFNNESVRFWEQHLRNGRRIPAVGGSDNHFLKRTHHAQLGHPTTWIYCSDDPSPANLVAALRAGHCFISETPNGPRLFIQAGDAMMGDAIIHNGQATLVLQVKAHDAQGTTLELIGSNGMLAQYEINADIWQNEVEIPVKGTTYIRGQIVDPPNRVRALTNPIYLQTN